MEDHHDVRAANRATFLAATSAISNGEYDALEALVTEDLVFDLPYGPSFMPNPVEGRATWMEMSRSTFKMFTSFHLEIDDVYDAVDPDLLIAEYHSDAVVAHNGNSYLNRYVGILRFRDGQISAWREFHNPEATKALM
jgi:ketosteroid isomerase-like protein